MASIWIAIIAVLTFVITISIVVIGEETHPLVAVLAFVAIGYLAYKLFQTRLTRL